MLRRQRVSDVETNKHKHVLVLPRRHRLTGTLSWRFVRSTKRPTLFICYLFQVVDPRAALLSNFEVLSLLRGLEADHLSRTKTAFRVKKEEEASAALSSFTIPGNISHLEASENLRTVQVEVCRFLFNNNNISLITYIMVSGNQLSLGKLLTKHLSERRWHHETCQRPRTV